MTQTQPANRSKQQQAKHTSDELRRIREQQIDLKEAGQMGGVTYQCLEEEARKLEAKLSEPSGAACDYGCNMRDGPNPKCPEHWKEYWTPRMDANGIHSQNEYEEWLKTTALYLQWKDAKAERDRLKALNAELLAALKSARLMLHAFRAYRDRTAPKDCGPHSELLRAIAEIESTIAKAQGQ